ncbi:MAG: CHASE2 domain-containing protein, partial [Devosia sp.]
MRARLPIVGVVFAWAALLLAAWLGALQPLDNLLRDWRFSAQTRAATGSAIFVDIDARSLEQIGVWPWPRTIHARILDALMAAGATETVFDIDFSVASNDTDDTAFARSLSDAGGFASLAAFLQQNDAFNLPLPRFRQ